MSKLLSKYTKYKVIDLKDRLRHLGLPLGGLKKDLIERLLEYEETQEQYIDQDCPPGTVNHPRTGKCIELPKFATRKEESDWYNDLEFNVPENLKSGFKFGYFDQRLPEYEQLNAVLYNLGLTDDVNIWTKPGQRRTIFVFVRPTTQKPTMTLKQALVPFGFKKSEKIFVGELNESAKYFR